MKTVGFGHDFSRVRLAASAVDRQAIIKFPWPGINSCLPSTYSVKRGQVEARSLSLDRLPQLTRLKIGEMAIERLKAEGVAELNLAGNLNPAAAERALTLLANNWTRLVRLVPSEIPLALSFNLLPTSEVPLSWPFPTGADRSTIILRQHGLYQIMQLAMFASTRLDGELMMLISRANPGYPQLQLGTEPVKELFADLKLKEPTAPFKQASDPGVVIDLARIFAGGGLYHGLVYLPPELLQAEAQPA
ncbi:MAG: hypothetical protein MUC35_03365 [Candidatus Margulisbacteria bacterium]|jgi:hypothetical protein|nr:hypothetical protein [Candidatus Margulisiibacteriota bacterium]